MNDNEKKQESYREFQLLSEIEKGDLVSQRELSRRLGIALGLVNSYLKNLVAKGYIRVKAFPRNRYSYLLTPKGISEKSRLAYQHLSYFTNLYRVTRQDYLTLFRTLSDQGGRQVTFCGVDEVAEIAYLSLLETKLELVSVVDVIDVGGVVFGCPVWSLVKGRQEWTGQIVVLTSLKRGGELKQKLIELGFDSDRIVSVNNY